MKKLFFLLITASLMSCVNADDVVPNNPDAIIVFNSNNQLDYVTPNTIISSRGRMVIWRADTSRDINICIEPGYVIPFEEDYMNGRCLKATKVDANNLIKAKLVKDFKGIPFPEGKFITVEYSVTSGSKTIDPILQIY